MQGSASQFLARDAALQRAWRKPILRQPRDGQSVHHSAIASHY
jgi:hypothetical protein